MHDVFPFFVTFQDLNWQLSNTAQDVAMLENLPHISNDIYLIKYVNIHYFTKSGFWRIGLPLSRAEVRLKLSILKKRTWIR